MDIEVFDLHPATTTTTSTTTTTTTSTTTTTTSTTTTTTSTVVLLLTKELLEKVQHRFTRMIEGFSLVVPYEEGLWKLGLWTLEERRNRSDLIEVFKMFSGYTEIDILFTLMAIIRVYEATVRKYVK